MDTSLKTQVFTLLSVVLLLCSPLTAAAAISPTQGVTPDDILMRVSVDNSGDAHWTIEYRTRLDDADTSDAFASLQSDIKSNPEKYESQLAARMNSTLTTAEDNTGRNMSITNVTVETETTSFPQSYGIVRYEFDWKGFAATANTSENRIISIGDSLSNFFVDGNMRLVISWPGNYDAQSITPNPDSTRADNEIVWEGPISFGEQEPRISLVKPLGIPAYPTTTDDPASLPTTTPPFPDTTTPTPTTTDDPSPPADTPDTANPDFLLVLVLLGGAAGAVLVYRQYTATGEQSLTETAPAATADTEGEGDGDGDGDDPDSSTNTDDDTDEMTTENTEPTEPAETASDTDAAAVSASDSEPDESDTGSGPDSDTDSDSEPDFDLMSNEEQVRYILDANGGRVKQQQIVDETGWSASKTSNVVNDMKDDGAIDVFRIGRENIVSLPDEAEASDGQPS